MPQKCTLNQAQINHLRRLLGYVRCEIGQSPEDMAATTLPIMRAIGMEAIDEDGLQRLRESVAQSAAVPRYVRAAVKSLERAIVDFEAEVVAEPGEPAVSAAEVRRRHPMLPQPVAQQDKEK